LLLRCSYRLLLQLVVPKTVTAHERKTANLAEENWGMITASYFFTIKYYLR